MNPANPQTAAKKVVLAMNVLSEAVTRHSQDNQGSKLICICTMGLSLTNARSQVVGKLSVKNKIYAPT